MFPRITTVKRGAKICQCLQIVEAYRDNGRITQPGDLWMLGDHRLLCGDAGNAEDVDRLLENDFVSDEQFAGLLRDWFGQIARVLLPGRAAYVWSGYANCANYPAALKEAGLCLSQAIIWDKEHPVLTRKDFMGAHEWCFYCWREGAAHVFLGPNNVPDLWRIKKVNPQNVTHLTEKPVELATRSIQYSSRAGENVLDLFGGSGSTLIAVEQTGRRAFLMELDPLYCDVIVQRWEKLSGRNSVRNPWTIDPSTSSPPTHNSAAAGITGRRP